MISVTVKTLDSQNHAFDVEEDIKVKEFKEVISPTIGIPVDQQRLIFRGRVLQDDKKISEYNVAGSVVHVVQRPANQNNPANDEPPPRPAGQAGRDMGGGMFVTGDEGGGRNAIIMGAIGLPTIDIENGAGYGVGENSGPRRSGAQVRLLVGNHMLNRASNLLHQLEDDDAGSGSGQGQNQASPSADLGLLIEEEAEIEMDIDMEDDQESLQRIISQVVNASSAAALVAAVGQVHPGGGAPLPPGAMMMGGLPQHPAPPNSSSNVPPGPGVSVPPSSTGPGSVRSDTSGESNAATAGSSGSQSGRAAPGRPESPRLRELATSLQDLLALQERLTPFLRFLQRALSQNRELSEPGETQSTQFLYDTISNILHILSHSLHAFSDIMCDFSIAPEQRRLIAPSSIVVEQSTVVRATIPVAAVPAMYATGGGLGVGQNAPAGAGGTGAQPNSQSAGGNAGNPLAGLGFSLPMGQMQMGQGIPLGFSMPMGGGGMRLLPSGMNQNQNQPWRNPNLHASTNTTPSTGGTGANPPPQQQPQQQQQPAPQATPANGHAHGGAAGNNQNQNQNQQIPGLPAGLQNLGALLGMAGGGSTVNVNVFAGPAGGSGGTGGAGGFFPQGTIPLGAFRSQIPPNNNAGSGAGTGPAVGGIAGGNPGGFFVFPQGHPQSQQNPPSASNNGTNSSNGTGNQSQANGGGGGGMLQNLLRNEMNRPQFDSLLPCHTIHSPGARFTRSSAHHNETPHPTRRPVEFRHFINLEDGAQQQAGSGAGGAVWGTAEGESLDIVMDLLRHSRLVDLWLVPLARDAVLNYLMRGRDPKNDAHVRTCAKSLAKKLLPFLEKFLAKLEGRNEAVDIPATYTNIFTEFIATLMKKIIEGGAHFQKDLLNALTELQKKLVHAFRLCYSSAGTGNNSVGLRFVNYLVEQLLGGMSIIFKTQARQKLTQQLKEIEGQAAGVGDAGSGSFIVYKDRDSQASAPLGGPPTPPKTMATAASGSGNVVPSPSPSSGGSRPRCAASFGDASPSLEMGGGAESVASSSSSSGSPVKQDVKVAAAAVSDDLDIDEVLQLPPSMVQQGSSPQRRTTPVGGSPQATNQTETFASLVRNLPSEWENTVVQDVRRQRDMPAQPSFSPGYNTLFPRKH